MLYLDPKALLAAADLPKLMDRMEEALLAEEAGKAVLPLRTSVFRGEDTLMLMPCLEERTWGLKILTLKPGNPAQAPKVRMTHAGRPAATSRTGRAALPEAASRTLARRAPNVYHPPAKGKDFAATRPPYPPAQAG